MLDYYSILKLPRDATSEDIKVSYKKLAKAYHPDINPGNMHAEEEFKRINEAYQVLSDPQKKSVYDNNLLFSEYSSTKSSHPHGHYTSTYSKPKKNPWKSERPNYHRRPVKYIFDKEYYRVTIIMVCVFVGLIFSAYAAYFGRLKYNEWQDEQERIYARHLTDSLNWILSNHQYLNAANFSKELTLEFPTNYDFFQLKDSVFEVIQFRAHQEFQNKNYDKSMELFKIFKKNRPEFYHNIREEMLYNYVKLDKADSAISELEQFASNNPNNIRPHILLAKIYLEDLKVYNKASQHIDAGKDLFRSLMRREYGNAYELVIDGPKSPEMFYELFQLRSRINIQNNDLNEAYSDSNWMVFFRPNYTESLETRIFLALNTSNKARLCEDIQNLNNLTGESNYQKISEICS